MPISIDDAVTTFTPGPYTMTGNQIYGFIFSPSARRNEDDGSQFLRESAQCFMRGYSERVGFESSTGGAWLWRRLVFATKAPLHNAFPSNTLDFPTTPQGQMRLLWNLFSGNAAATTALAFTEDLVFQGTKNEDWSSYFTAQVDPNNITLLYSHMRTISSRVPDKGTFHVFKNWVPINKNIEYDDQESGDDPILSSPWSVQHPKGGLGDVYVMDMFACAAGVVGDSAALGPDGTWYWHER